MKLPCAAAICIVLSAAVDVSQAQGWGALMKNTPMEDFTEEDLAQYTDVLNGALDAPLPVEPREWRNDRTGSGARIEVLGATKVENFDDCRRVRTDLYSKKHKRLVRTWTACKTADGEWGLVSAN
jgi:hypothetical protein